MWELSDPNIPTHRKGSTLDKIMLLPRTNIPEEWLPSEVNEWGGVEADVASGERGLDVSPFYPAHTYEFPAIADHHSVVLYFQSGRELPQIPIKALRVSQLRKEEWAEKNAAPADYLESKNLNVESCVKEKNPPHVLRVLSGGIRSCFKEQYRAANPIPKDEDPFLRFCKRHIDDPDYPLLIRAHSEGGDLLKRKLINAISRRGWRAHPATVRPSNTSALFTFLARQEGRKPRPG